MKQDSSKYQLKDNWKSEKIAPDLPVLDILKETNFFKVPPKIKKITIKDSIATIKTEFYLPNGAIHSIYISIAKKSPNNGAIYFIPFFDYYTLNMSNKKIGTVNYYFNENEYSINLTEANNLISFNKKMASLFNTKEIFFDYYIFKDTKERMLADGYEYHYLTKKRLNNSAHADLNNNLIVVGQYVSTYPHEVVHLYTAKYYPNVHTWMDEGLAEYLGVDSNQLEKNRKIIMNFLIKNPQPTKDIFSIPEGIAKNGTSLKYDFGSLIVEKIHEKRPNTWLTDILTNGSDDQSFYTLLEKTLGVKQENIIDSLIHWSK